MSSVRQRMTLKVSRPSTVENSIKDDCGYRSSRDGARRSSERDDRPERDIAARVTRSRFVVGARARPALESIHYAVNSGAARENDTPEHKRQLFATGGRVCCEKVPTTESVRTAEKADIGRRDKERRLDKSRQGYGPIAEETGGTRYPYIRAKTAPGSEDVDGTGQRSESPRRRISRAMSRNDVGGVEDNLHATVPRGGHGASAGPDASGSADRIARSRCARASAYV